MDEPPFTEENQLELVKHQVNKMIEMGVYTAPDDWEPYEVSESVQSRIDKAKEIS